jgi:hypothetical protein
MYSRRQRWNVGKQLLPTTAVACKFPIPDPPGTTGLQIDFGTMLELSEIMSDVTLESKDG